MTCGWWLAKDENIFTESANPVMTSATLVMSATLDNLEKSPGQSLEFLLSLAHSRAQVLRSGHAAAF